MNLQELLEYTFKVGASDLHLTVGLPPMVRIDAQLHQVDGWPRLMPDNIRALAYEFLNQRQVDDLMARREIHTAHHVQGAGRLRISIYHQRGSLGIAMRVIDAHPPSLEDLGLPDVVRKFALVEHGLVLICGPAGAGKTTTLAALAQYINERRACHILSIEDPIEFLLRHGRAVVEQRQIGDDVYTYAQAMRSLPRQDADVALIGDLPDVEAVEAALELAESGVLVLAGMRATNTTIAVRRLINAFPVERQTEVAETLGNVIVGALAQHLVPRTAGHGRVLALEVLVALDAVRGLIRDRNIPGLRQAIESGGKDGMFSLNATLLRLWRDSIISREHALSRASDLKTLLKQMS